MWLWSEQTDEVFIQSLGQNSNVRNTKASQLEGCVSNSQTLSDSPWCSLGKTVRLNRPGKKQFQALVCC